MKYWDLFFALVTLAVASMGVVMLIGPAQLPPQPDYELRTAGKLLVFDQPGKRAIYCRPESITAFAVWGRHPEYQDVVMLQVGATEYRLDCSSPERAAAIEAFLSKHLQGKTNAGP